MGSWGPGPFQNDAALDHVGRVCETLMGSVRETLEKRTLGSAYLRAVASLAILTEIARISPVRPRMRVADEDVDPEALRAKLLALFDERCDDDDFDEENRRVLSATLDSFVAACGVSMRTTPEVTRETPDAGRR